MCAVFSVQAKMSAFKGVRSQKPIPDFKQQLAATLTQNVKPSSLRAQPFKPAKTQSDTDSSGSSRPSHHVSVASIKAARMNYNRLGSTTVLKPETKESHVPSFPKVRQHIKPPLAQRLTNRDDGVENIIRAKPPKLPEMQNYIRTCRTQTKVQRVSSDPSVPKKRLPDVLLLGSPPPKPQRPPSVDIHRFRGSLTCVNDGRDDLKQEEEAWPIIYEFEAEPDVYDDLGAPAEVCSGLNVQNIEEDDVYDMVNDPDARVSPLPQPNTDGDEVYDTVDYDDFDDDDYDSFD